MGCQILSDRVESSHLIFLNYFVVGTVLGSVVGRQVALLRRRCELVGLAAVRSLSLTIEPEMCCLSMRGSGIYLPLL